MEEKIFNKLTELFNNLNPEINSRFEDWINKIEELKRKKNEDDLFYYT